MDQLKNYKLYSSFYLFTFLFLETIYYFILALSLSLVKQSTNILPHYFTILIIDVILFNHVSKKGGYDV